MSQVDISGSISIGGESCGSGSGGCGGGSGDLTVRALGDECGAKTYGAVFATSQPSQVLTSGAVGAAFVDLPVGEALERIEFLHLRSSSEMVLRIDGKSAKALGAGGTFPTLFAGGETLQIAIDGGATITVTFLATDQTAVDCAARINSALALVGLPTPRAVVGTTGQLEIESVTIGKGGKVEIVGGTGMAQLGFSVGETLGSGELIKFNGLLMIEFPRNENAPKSLQVSGNGALSAVVGGR